MPVYKEIQVNIQVSPEALLGGLMGAEQDDEEEQTMEVS